MATIDPPTNCPDPVVPKNSGYRPEDRRLPKKVELTLTGEKLLDALRRCLEVPKRLFGEDVAPDKETVRAAVFFRGLPDRDLMEFFVKVHVQNMERGQAFLELIPALEKMKYRRKRLGLDTLALAARAFLDASASLVKVLEDPNKVPPTVAEQVRGTEELDLEREYRELLMMRKGLLQQLDRENAQAPLIVFFDKKDKALSGLESTLGSVAKFHQMIGKLAATNVVLTHRIESAVQLLLDVPSDQKSAMRKAALAMVEYLENNKGDADA